MLKGGSVCSGAPPLLLYSIGADLNPLDYCLWADIERRMLATKKQGKESKAAYAKRLRRVAFQTDRATVRKAVQAPPSQTFSTGQWN